MHPLHVLLWSKAMLTEEQERLIELETSQRAAIDKMNDERRKSWLYRVFPSLYKDDTLDEWDMSWFRIDNSKSRIGDFQKIINSATYFYNMDYPSFEFDSVQVSEKYSSSFYAYCMKNKIPR